MARGRPTTADVGRVTAAGAARGYGAAMAAVDLVALAFHFSGVLVLGVLAWALRDVLRALPDEPRPCGDGGSDRIGPQPPWSWQPHGGRSAGRRTRAARPARPRMRR
jgi:hypothetical protein